MKILDLYCCCGGVSTGLYDNGNNDVVGIDINNNHNYPFNFIQSNVFDLKENFLDRFDFIWASPPCQHYTWSTRKDRTEKFPNLIDKTRNLLKKTGKPFVIENVVGSPLRKDLILCGEMFGLRVLRHRVFEVEGFTILQPPHIKHREPISKNKSYYACVAGHGGDSYSFRIDDWKNAMGIDWVNDKNHLVEMIPPSYSNFIIKNFMLEYN